MHRIIYDFSSNSFENLVFEWSFVKKQIRFYSEFSQKGTFLFKKLAVLTV